VPNTRVRWTHAWVGGLFVASGIELAKKGVTLYISSIPTYAMVYGAFAALPILLLWVYMAWLIVLMGAVITAYLPSLLSGVTYQARRHGAHFQWAVGILQQLHQNQPPRGSPLSQGQLGRSLRVDPLSLEPVLEVLLTLEWIGRVSLAQTAKDDGFVLLVDARQTALDPLISLLLLDRHTALDAFWRNARFAELRLVDLL
jgi:membrane protein